MKKITVLLGGWLGAVALANAGTIPCSSLNNLNQYIAASACSIGVATFSNFVFTQTGSDVILDPASILVAVDPPSAPTGHFGLGLSSTNFHATNGQVLAFALNYSVAAPHLSAYDLALAGFQGDGTLQAKESLPGVPGSTLTLNTDGALTRTVDATTLNVKDYVSLSSNGGDVSITQIGNTV